MIWLVVAAFTASMSASRGDHRVHPHRLSHHTVARSIDRPACRTDHHSDHRVVADIERDGHPYQIGGALGSGLRRLHSATRTLGGIGFEGTKC